MDRSEIRTRILRLLNAPAGTFWSNTQINALIDECAEILAEESRAIKRTVYFPRLPGTMFYTLQSLGPDLMCPYRLYAMDMDRRLDTATFADLDSRHYRWLEQSREPWVWGMYSWDAFFVWPGEGEGGGVMQADCYAWAPALLDDGDEPEYPQADHDAYVLYGLYEGLLKRWDVIRASQVLARFAEQAGLSQFRSGMKVLKERDWHRESSTGHEPSVGIP